MIVIEDYKTPPPAMVRFVPEGKTWLEFVTRLAVKAYLAEQGEREAEAHPDFWWNRIKRKGFRVRQFLACFPFSEMPDTSGWPEDTVAILKTDFQSLPLDVRNKAIAYCRGWRSDTSQHILLCR